MLMKRGSHCCCHWRPNPAVNVLGRSPGAFLVAEGSSASVHGGFSVTHCKMMSVSRILLVSLLRCLENTGTLGIEKASLIEETRKLLPFTVCCQNKPKRFGNCVSILAVGRVCPVLIFDQG